MVKTKFKINSKGYTLIEVLVATFLLGASLVLILQLFSSGLKSSKLSENYLKAILHAKNKIEEKLLMEEQVEGEWEGVFEDGFKWTNKVSIYETKSEDIKKGDSVLFEIRVVVSWAEGNMEKKYSINTLKLAQIGEDSK